MHSRQNNFEKSYTEKKTKYTPSGYSWFTNCSFDATKNRFDCYKGEDCMERFCEDLRDHAMKITNYEEQEMIPLTNKKINLMKTKRFVTYAKKNLVLKKMIKMHLNFTMKSEFIVFTLENLEELPIVFAIQDKITKRNSNSIS